MKYRLEKDLPFMKKGEIFGTGCWVGGGFGIDMGNDTHGSHKGVKTFSKSANDVLEDILRTKEWVMVLPESVNDVLELYEEGYLSQNETRSYLSFKPIP